MRLIRSRGQVVLLSALLTVSGLGVVGAVPAAAATATTSPAHSSGTQKPPTPPQKQPSVVDTTLHKVLPAGRVAGARKELSPHAQAPARHQLRAGAFTGAGHDVPADLPPRLRRPTDSSAQYLPPAVTRKVATGSALRTKRKSANLAATGTVSGTVGDSVSGLPIGGVCIDFYSYADNSVTEVCTASNGTYSVGLPPGQYDMLIEDHVHAHMSTYDNVQVVAGTTATRDEQMDQGSAVSGKVTDASGNPLPNICVTLFTSQGDYEDGGACTAADGTYQTTGVPAGDHVAYFRDRSGPYLGAYFGGSSASTATPITTTQASVTPGIDVSLDKGGTISGTIVDAQGAPVAGVDVEVDGAGSGASGTTAADGTYTTSGLVTGASYQVRFYPTQGNNLASFYGASSGSQPAPVSVTKGSNTPGIGGTLPMGGTLAGTVTDTSGTPLAGACVLAHTEDYEVYQSACTASDGTYRVVGLRTDTYDVAFSGADGSGYLQASQTGVTATAGVDRTGLDQQLVLGGAISGTITASAGGAAVAGACGVALLNGDYAGDAICADSSGHYSIVGLDTGSYTVRFFAHGFSEQFYDHSETQAGATRVAVTRGSATTSIDAALAVAPTITGTLTAQGSGTALAGCVFAQSSDTFTNVAAYCTNANGHFTLTLPHAGSFVVYANAPHYLDGYSGGSSEADATVLTLADGHTATADVALVRSSSFSGTVTGTDTGAPLAGLAVRAMSGGDYVGSYGRTDRNGHYVVDGLTAGSYAIRVFGDDDHVGALSDPTAVAEAQNTVLNETLDPAAKISGTVTTTDGGSPSLCVYASNVNGEQQEGDSSTVCGVGTTYTLGGLRTGDYVVQFSDDSGNYLTLYYNQARDAANATNVSATQGSTTPNVNARLSPAAHVAGTITEDGTGAPVSGVCASAYGTDGSFVGNGTCSDDAGHYDIGGLATGQVKVRFDDYSGQHVSEWARDKGTFDAADSLTVTEGSATTVDESLAPAATLSGTVTDDTSGDGLAGIEVDLYAANTKDYVSSSSTDSDGSYTVGGLVAGDYLVEFIDYGGGHLTQWANGKADEGSADPVTLAGGRTTTLDAALSSGAKIQGTLTDAGTGEPIQGACAYAFVPSNVYSSVSFGCSDANGRYTIAALTGGTYLVEFTDQNGKHLSQWANGQADSSSADFINVADHGLTTGVDASLVLGGSISGTLTDATTGDPVQACVTLRAPDGSYTPYNGVCTDNAGHYSTGGLPSGNYVLEFSAYQYIDQFYRGADTVANATPVAVTVGQEATGIDDTLSRGASITGHIADEHGSPVTEHELYIVDPDGYIAATGFTDENGDYTAGGLRAGSYRLFSLPTSDFSAQWFQDAVDEASATDVSVAADSVVSHVDFTLHPGVQLRGTITDRATGDPIPNECVYAYPADRSTSFAYVNACADSNGQYVTDAVPAGQYHLYTYNYGRLPYIDLSYGQSSSTDPETLVNVGTSAGPDYDFALERGATVSGHITDKATGAPLAGVCVELQVSGNWSGYTCSGNDGSYTSMGVSSGTYDVYFINPNGRYIPAYLGGGSSASPASKVTLASGEDKSGVDMQMVLGGTLAGTIKDAGTGAGLGGVCATLYTTSGTSVGRAACSTSNGSYSGTIAAGTYKVLFTDPTGQYADQYYDHKTTLASADTVTIVAGGGVSAVDADLTPVPSQVITGSVQDGNGSPLSGICVYPYSGGTYAGHGTCTDATGHYTVQGLSAGSYKLGFYDPTGSYTTSWYLNQPTQSAASAIALVSGQDSALSTQVMQHVATISGTVTSSSGGSVRGVCAYLYTDANGYRGIASCLDNGGHYTLVGMSAGTYKVAFSDGGVVFRTRWSSASDTQASATPVAVNAGQQVTGVDAVITPMSTVSGHVTDSVTNAAVPNVCAYLYNASDDSYSGNGSCTNSSGDYSVVGAPAGTYVVKFFDPSGTHTTQSSPSFSVNDGVTHTENAVMAARTSITGVLTDSVSGNPVGNVCAYLYTASSGAYANYGTCSDGSGQYTLAGMPAGTYKIAFYDPTAAHATTWSQNAYSKASATPFTLTDGQHLTVSQAVAPVATMTGFVKGLASGTGQANVCVYADDSTGAYTGIGACTDSTGKYTLKGFAPGSYKLGFYPAGQSSPTPYWYLNQATEASATAVVVSAGESKSLSDEHIGL